MTDRDEQKVVNPRITAALLAIAVVATGSAVAGAPVGEATASHSGSVDDGEIVEVHTVSTAETDSGEVRIDISYHVGDSVSGLDVQFREDVTVVETDGFGETEDGVYQWDERTSKPTISVVRDANQSSDRFSGLDFVDAGDWVLTGAVSTEVGFRFRPGVDVSRRVTARAGDDDGIAGGRWVYVGAAETATFEGDGEEITVVASDAATLPGNLSNLQTTLQETSGMLEAGGRTDELTLFVVTDPLRRGGLATSDGTDVWVHNASIDPPRTALWHEYTHSRQAYRPESATRWTFEGVAEYYGFLLGVKQGDIEYHQFHDHFADADQQHSGVTLDNPETWRGTDADYELGGLAIAALDGEIRTESDGAATFEDAFRAANSDDDDGLTGDELEQAASGAAGTDMTPFFDEHVRSQPGSLDVPPPDAYDASMDGAAPRLDVAGTAVEPGESGALRVTITNDGDETSLAPYLTVDLPAEFESSDTAVDDTAGSDSALTRVDGGYALDHLAPGENVTVVSEFTASPETPLDPQDVDLTVTDMSGQSATATATVAVGDVPTAELDTTDGVPVGEATTFDASASSDDAVSYRWTIAGPTDDTVETDGPTLEYTFEDPGEYDVTLTVENDEGFTATSSATVVASDRPAVEIDGPTQVDPGDSATFAVNVTNEFGTTETTWEVFDQTAEGPSVEVTFQQVGEREIRATVTDEYGASGSASTTITVGDPASGDGTSGTSSPAPDDVGTGFGVVAAVLALTALAVVSLRRRA